MISNKLLTIMILNGNKGTLNDVTSGSRTIGKVKEIRINPTENLQTSFPTKLKVDLKRNGDRITLH